MKCALCLSQQHHQDNIRMKWGLLAALAIVMATTIDAAPGRALIVEESQEYSKQIREKNQRHLEGKARIRDAQEGRFWRNHL